MATTTRKTTLQISGMTCASCAARIERGLSRMDGVTSAAVNLTMETASVEYNQSLVDVEAVITKVEGLGFQAEVKRDSKPPAELRQAEIRKLRYRLIVSALLSFPLLLAMAGHFSFTDFIPLPEW